MRLFIFNLEPVLKFDLPDKSARLAGVEVLLEGECAVAAIALVGERGARQIDGALVERVEHVANRHAGIHAHVDEEGELTDERHEHAKNDIGVRE